MREKSVAVPFGGPIGAQPHTMVRSSVHKVKGTNGSSIATSSKLALQLTEELRLALVATSKLKLIHSVSR